MKFLVHGYADDHQVYKSFTCATQYSILVSDIPQCFQQINTWMAAYFLDINPGKTDIIVFATPKILKLISIQGTFLDSKTCIRFSPVVKNLGFRLDSCLTLQKQVNYVKSACYIRLRTIAKMKPFLNIKQLTMLTQASIMLLMDYCNALYHGCNENIMKDLQNIQNRACRVIFGTKKHESITNHLKKLHWLKIKERIEFKLLLLTYKCIYGQAPIYLCDTICLTNVNNTRAPSLHIPTDVSIDRAFSVAAPKLWNSIPIDIRSAQGVNDFKRKLKTYLFKCSYNC